MSLLTPSSRKAVKALSLMIVALIAMTSFTSCDDDDDEWYYTVEGSWEQVAPPTREYVYYEFYEDGYGNYIVDDPRYGADYYEFSWWVSGSSLTIDYGGGDAEYYSWSVQGSTLYLYPDYGNPIVLNAIH
ncbi:hypothetical protein [uncultured Duncaniella sp.]|uniref:hypothetical protein n=1 Tax=uncultured Duncaniella sp. TaxID=2768039 RepID=UPI002649733D|nr:hypothetical protein [uncultured Duncaniella sp.]